MSSNLSKSLTRLRAKTVLPAPMNAIAATDEPPLGLRPPEFSEASPVCSWTATDSTIAQ